jgi:serine/threonine-protein kinase
MTCPRCGAANSDDARFCGVCGAATSATDPVSSPQLGAAPVLIGREIAGRYRVLAKLGEGGMGAVFRAEQISLKRTVAVKLLRPDVSANPMLLRRFNAEAEAVAKLSHPNTVNIYDFGQDTDGTLFIAMELIEGRSLRSVIHAEAPLAVRRALAIAQQVAASLSDAHARAIVHRDLKPDNVMLQDRGRERDIARVLDFGIAKLRDDTRATQQAMTQQGDMLGTPQYMAPEQIRAEPIDGRTDIYALGCLLYEMVTGRLPHDAPTVLAMLSKHLIEHPVPPSQRRPELGLPEAIDRLILGAMAKSPHARPPTMEAFGEQIAALLEAQPPDPRSAQRSAAVAVPGVPTPTPASFAADTPAAHSAFPGAVPVTPHPTGGGVSPYAPGGHAPHAGQLGQPMPPMQPPMQPMPPMQPPGQPMQPGPPRFALPPPPSRRTGMIAIAVLLVASAGIAALAISQRGGTPAEPTEPSQGEDRDEADPAEPTEPTTPPPPPGPTPPVVDPWAGSPGAPPDKWAGTPDTDGRRLAVGQGVEILFPSEFRTTVKDGATLAVDDRNVVIAAAPIDHASNDPSVLAKDYARRFHLVYDSRDTIFVGGVQRPKLNFHATVDGVLVRNVAVPLIGPGYRIAVVFQAPDHLTNSDPSVAGLMFDLYTRRITLPSDD